MTHTRLVWGTVHRADGSPWPGFAVGFDVPKTAQAPHATIPGTRVTGPPGSGNTITVTTDDTGRWEATLEVNVPLQVSLPGAYVKRGSSTLYPPGSSIPIVVPEGDTPISLMTILAAEHPDPADPTLPNIVAAVEADLAELRALVEALGPPPRRGYGHG